MASVFVTLQDRDAPSLHPIYAPHEQGDAAFRQAQQSARERLARLEHLSKSSTEPLYHPQSIHEHAAPENYHSSGVTQLWTSHPNKNLDSSNTYYNGGTVDYYEHQQHNYECSDHYADASSSDLHSHLYDTTQNIYNNNDGYHQYSSQHNHIPESNSYYPVPPTSEAAITSQSYPITSYPKHVVLQSSATDLAFPSHDENYSHDAQFGTDCQYSSSTRYPDGSSDSYASHNVYQTPQSQEVHLHPTHSVSMQLYTSNPQQATITYSDSEYLSETEIATDVVGNIPFNNPIQDADCYDSVHAPYRQEYLLPPVHTNHARGGSYVSDAYWGSEQSRGQHKCQPGPHMLADNTNPSCGRYTDGAPVTVVAVVPSGPGFSEPPRTTAALPSIPSYGSDMYVYVHSTAGANASSAASACCWPQHSSPHNDTPASTPAPINNATTTWLQPTGSAAVGNTSSAPIPVADKGNNTAVVRETSHQSTKLLERTPTSAQFSGPKPANMLPCGANALVPVAQKYPSAPHTHAAPTGAQAASASTTNADTARTPHLSSIPYSASPSTGNTVPITSCAATSGPATRDAPLAAALGTLSLNTTVTAEPLRTASGATSRVAPSPLDRAIAAAAAGAWSLCSAADKPDSPAMPSLVPNKAASSKVPHTAAGAAVCSRTDVPAQQLASAPETTGTPPVTTDVGASDAPWNITAAPTTATSAHAPAHAPVTVGIASTMGIANNAPPINIPGTTKGWLPGAATTKKRVFKALLNPEDKLNNDLSRALGDIGVLKPPQHSARADTIALGKQ